MYKITSNLFTQALQAQQAKLYGRNTEAEQKAMPTRPARPGIDLKLSKEAKRLIKMQKSGD